MKRTLILMYSALGTLALEVLGWVIGKVLDANATPENGTYYLTKIYTALSYINGRFALGFILGAFLFSIWDWPALKKYLNRKALKKIRAEELSLATNCETIATELNNRHAKLQQIIAEANSEVDMENPHENWQRHRRISSREMEKIQTDLGQLVRKTIALLKEKHMDIDDKATILTEWNLQQVAYLFTECSQSLINGTHTERAFILIQQHE